MPVFRIQLPSSGSFFIRIMENNLRRIRVTDSDVVLKIHQKSICLQYPESLSPKNLNMYKNQIFSQLFIAMRYHLSKFEQPFPQDHYDILFPLLRKIPFLKSNHAWLFEDYPTLMQQRSILFRLPTKTNTTTTNTSLVVRGDTSQQQQKQNSSLPNHGDTRHMLFLNLDDQHFLLFSRDEKKKIHIHVGEKDQVYVNVRKF